MKSILLGIAIAGLSISSVVAATCEDRAEACMKNNGKQDKCYGAALAQCKKTGTYIGPYTGKAFPATK
jgi:hypothetical protein